MYSEKLLLVRTKIYVHISKKMFRHRPTLLKGILYTNCYPISSFKLAILRFLAFPKPVWQCTMVNILQVNINRRFIP